MASPCTLFMDMHSGGGIKAKPFDYIYIELPEKQARKEFERLTCLDPDNVTCSCCGPDYSVSESESTAQASAFDRGCAFESGRYVEKPRCGRVLTEEEFFSQPDVVVVRLADVGKFADLTEAKAAMTEAE